MPKNYQNEMLELDGGGRGTMIERNATGWGRYIEEDGELKKKCRLKAFYKRFLMKY